MLLKFQLSFKASLCQFSEMSTFTRVLFLMIGNNTAKRDNPTLTDVDNSVMAQKVPAAFSQQSGSLETDFFDY